MPTDASRRRWLYAALGLVVGAVVAVLAVNAWGDDDSAVTPDDVDAAVAEALANQSTAPDASSIYEQIAPSIVEVTATRSSGDTISATGVVINDDGEIVASNDVVQGADQIDVRFHDGTTSSATLLSDEASPVAILAADDHPATATAAVLGNSRTVQVGDPIYAVGNPVGLPTSMTAGIISALSDMSEADEASEGLIHFDAAVSEGSQGGPLLNADGHVIGIIDASADPTGEGFSSGIGFAVPVDIAVASSADGPSQ